MPATGGVTTVAIVDAQSTDLAVDDRAVYFAATTGAINRLVFVPSLR